MFANIQYCHKSHIAENHILWNTFLLQAVRSMDLAAINLTQLAFKRYAFSVIMQINGLYAI